MYIKILKEIRTLKWMGMSIEYSNGWERQVVLTYVIAIFNVCVYIYVPIS